MSDCKLVEKTTSRLEDTYERFYRMFRRDIKQTKMVLRMREAGILTKAEAREILSLPVIPDTQRELVRMHVEAEDMRIANDKKLWCKLSKKRKN